jgi:hypothetical protein
MHSGGGQATVAEVPDPGKPVATSCRPGRVRLGSGRFAYVAFIKDRASVYRRPGGPVVARFDKLRPSFDRSSSKGVPTVLAVESELRGRDCRPLWYRVRTPGPPNGLSGYVRPDELELAYVRTRIVVDLSERRLTLFEDGRPLLVARVAVGSPAAPTPRGTFYVEERIRIADSSGPYGAAALALSGFSEILTDWPQGGPIALHGTNDPSSIGRAVSHGCIRVGARDLQLLFEHTQLGTPVRIGA